MGRRLERGCLENIRAPYPLACLVGTFSLQVFDDRQVDKPLGELSINLEQCVQPAAHAQLRARRS